MFDTVHLDIRITQDEDVTTAVLDSGDRNYFPVGSAKRHPRDPHVGPLGQVVALGRLFKKMSADYEAMAEKLMSSPSFGGVKAVESDPVMAAWLRQFGVPKQEI